VANQVKPQSRPLIFEDDPPTETRFRRVQSTTRKNNQTFADAPQYFDDPDDEDAPRSGSRFGTRRFQASGPWWRPVSTPGRVFLGLGILLVLSCVTTSVVVAKRYLSRDPRFRITGASNIEANGLTEVSRAELLPVFGEDIGRNIFFVPLSERRKQVEMIPWVQEATVMRLLPDHIRVNIVERQPVAFVRQGQQVGLVDANGVLLGMPAATMAQHHYSFPVVTGISARDPLPERRIRMGVYQRLLGELDANNQHLSQQISEVDLTDPQDARVLMPEQGADILAHFGEDKFLDRYHRYKTHIAEWRQEYPKLAAVDLRYESQVVLEMPKGTNAVDATLGVDSSSAPSLVAAPTKPAAGVATAAVATAAVAASALAATKPAAGKPVPQSKQTPIPDPLTASSKPVQTAKPALPQLSSPQESRHTEAQCKESTWRRWPPNSVPLVSKPPGRKPRTPRGLMARSKSQATAQSRRAARNTLQPPATLR